MGPDSPNFAAQVVPLFRDLIDDPHDPSQMPGTFLDVPFVPTDDEAVKVMLELAGLGPKDLLYDLGSGDGRIVIAAAKTHGAGAIGVEIDPLRIADAMEYAGDAGVEYLVDFIEEDIFTADFSQASVVALYLLESINIQLRPRLLAELRPGSRIVSHAFNMGDWRADEQRKLNGISLYKWIVPARVSGVWEWTARDGAAYRIELRQKYQEVTGSAWQAGEAAHLKSARLSGDMLELEIQTASADDSKRFTLNFNGGALHSVLENNN